MALFGLGNVTRGAHKAAQGGHHSLTEGVDAGVGDLNTDLVQGLVMRATRMARKKRPPTAPCNCMIILLNRGTLVKIKGELVPHTHQWKGGAMTVCFAD